MSENLWALREQKKLSIATLATRTDLPIGLIMEYESGQRSVDPRHIARLARALYIEESDLKLHSDPRPGVAPLERVAPHEALRAPVARPPAPTVVRERLPRPPRPPAEARPPAPARPSQIIHLENLLRRMGRTRADLEAEQGKPLAEMNRTQLAELLKALQAQAGSAEVVERHRAYLPEAVEEYESRYLSAAQAEGATLRFSLFDGLVVAGQIVGFGVYAITVRQGDGSELTLNKLALVSYRKEPAP